MRKKEEFFDVNAIIDFKIDEESSVSENFTQDEINVYKAFCRVKYKDFLCRKNKREFEKMILQISADDYYNSEQDIQQYNLQLIRKKTFSKFRRFSRGQKISCSKDSSSFDGIRREKHS